MKIETLLGKLDRAEVVEAVHLLSRYLAESPRSREELKCILAVDARGGDAVVGAVLAVVDVIEREAGAPIERLSSALRMKRVAALDKLLWRRIDHDRKDSVEVSHALEELRKVS